MRKILGKSGKWFIWIFVSVQLILWSIDVCAGIEVEPVNINAKTPNLNIEPSKKIPLKVAVVVPDPMAYTIYYETSGGGYERDMTGEYRRYGFFLEREMAKVCSETFLQVFSQVVIVRSLPQPGEYDAIVQVSMGKILLVAKVKSMFGKMQNDVTSEWSISVLNSQNIELLGKKGVTQSKSYEWDAKTVEPAFTKGLEQIISEALSNLAKEWGLLLYGSDALNNLAVKKNKP